MNVLVTHRVTRLCLPQLKKAKGCVVNIGSLASKVATPCLGGYAVSKSALSAYSQQLRMELRSDGVHVLMVCPGPIQRDDGGVRYNHLAEQRELAEQFRKPGGGAPQGARPSLARTRGRRCRKFAIARSRQAR